MRKLLLLLAVSALAVSTQAHFVREDVKLKRESVSPSGSNDFGVPPIVIEAVEFTDPFVMELPIKVSPYFMDSRPTATVHKIVSTPLNKGSPAAKLLFGVTTTIA